ncbi:hypothetical protein A4D02_06920 [Niastella koreensis]|uniref:Uncharacterized protein n=1 Tax=Niastella koreensis TaxID=354356 RepID=A0ABX3NW37_9BACT|nr:hypothetical protein A4D02_06920 [Niastella koreensis]
MVISIVTGSPVGWCGRREVAIAAGILMFIKFKILSANYKYPSIKKTACELVFQGRKLAVVAGGTKKEKGSSQ